MFEKVPVQLLALAFQSFAIISFKIIKQLSKL